MRTGWEANAIQVSSSLVRLKPRVASPHHLLLDKPQLLAERVSKPLPDPVSPEDGRYERQPPGLSMDQTQGRFCPYMKAR